MAHTPGPWKWCDGYLMQDDGVHNNPWETPLGRPIADDGSAGGEYSAKIDVDGPDARLIAAAPDLLTALKICRSFLGEVTILQILGLGDEAIDAVGLNPYCIEEGLATGDEIVSLDFIAHAITKAEGNKRVP